MKVPTIAICYDFDSTLSPNEMQAYGYFKALNTNSSEFWGKSDEMVKETSADRILVNMYRMMNEAKQVGITLTKEKLREFGATVDLFDGVETWFERINEFGKTIGVNVEHYLVSSGDKEMILGMQIAKFFKKIYACTYLYDENGTIIWPAISVNYTNKTQFLYRINKGCLDETDDSINDIMDKESRNVPFENMIYIGDSFTDIPCMRLVMNNGGKAIGVYNPQSKNDAKVQNLLNNNKINFIAPADYSKGKMLEVLVKEIIKGMKINDNLKTLTKAQKK